MFWFPCWSLHHDAMGKRREAYHDEFHILFNTNICIIFRPSWPDFACIIFIKKGKLREKLRQQILHFRYSFRTRDDHWPLQSPIFFS